MAKTNVSFLKVVNLNIRSLVPSFTEFSNVVYDKYDIICITETWLNTSIDSNIVLLPGYTFFRKDRKNKRGGGVGCYVRKSLSCEIIEYDTNKNVSFEFLLLKLKINTSKIALAVVYRPPDSNFNELTFFINEILSIMLIEYEYSIITGDFNVNMLVPNTLLNLFETYGYVNNIKEPTRIAATSATLLDPIFTNGYICRESGTVMCHVSDHNAMPYCILNIKINVFKQKLITVRDLKHLNLVDFKRDLLNINFDDIYLIDNINDKVKFLTSNINFLFNIHAPLKTIRVSKPPAPWLTFNLKMILKERDKALTKFKATKTPENWNYYKECRNYALASIRREKAAYLNKLQNERNEKKLWKELRYMNVKSSTLNSELPPNLRNPNEINEYFLSVHKKTDNCQEKINFYSNNSFCKNSFTFTPVSQNIVSDVINSINSNAAGNDGISLYMIKLCLPTILNHITHVIGCCLLYGYFPQSWRESVVCPLPKVPSPKTISDLRPISLLPVMSKILERVAYLQLSNHLISNNILASEQSGFRKDHSTTTALLNLTDNIIRALDKKLSVLLVALDYSKAFDLIDHDLLLAKLKYYGCDDTVLSFFKTYLWKRNQRVNVGGNYSSAKNIISGVPQGSVLGPLLFITYTSDLPGSVKSSIVQLFADDTQILHYFDSSEIHTANTLVNNDLRSIFEYSKEHNLSINPSKTKAVLFCSKTKRTFVENSLELELDGIKIPLSTEVKNLGLVIDQSLRFKTHIKMLIQRCHVKMRLLYLNRYILNFKMRKKLCESSILSTLNYCNNVYYPCLDKISQNQLQYIQNKCCRYIFNLKKYDHVSLFIAQLQWLKINKLFQLNFLTLLYRLLKTETPTYLFEKIQLRTSVHNLNIRHNTLTMPHHSSAMFVRSFTYNSVKLYNTFRFIMSSTNISRFRRIAKNILLDN